MTELKENLDDTKYLLEETEYKNTNNSEEFNLKNNLLNNTQLLLEDKSSILYDISNDNINNININQAKKENIFNLNQKEKELERENSIKDILIKNNNQLNIIEEKEKIKDEQEIIRQQNILLNNQSSHLDDLLSLSYHNNNIIQNKNKNKIVDYNNDLNYNQIYFGVIFPTEKIIKNICYKNDDTKKIICFNIVKSKNDNSNDEQYFKILIDKNKNYFNLKSKEEINIKILLEAPFIKHKKQLKCDIQIIDINNCLIDTFHLYANVEVPKLCCIKYKNKNINLKENNIPLIQIKLNLNDSNINNLHKFRIPLKNLSMKDLNINFNFISNPKEDNINNIIDYELFFENDKNIAFPSFDINYIEILLNLKVKSIVNKDNNNIKIKKIIEANLNETKINYYFCLEILIGYFNNDLNII